MEIILSIIEKYKNKGPKFHLSNLEKDLKDHIAELPGIGLTPLEDLYLISQSLTSMPQCPVCDKSKMFINYKKGYQNTCHSNECIKKYTQICRENSFLKKYGVVNPKQIKEVSDKIEKTNIERYGHKNAASCQIVKDKIKETFVKNYGVDNPLKSQEIKNRIKSTNKERYGVENTYQMEKVKDKIKETYGDDFGFGSNFFKEKSKETCNLKYGVDYHLQRSEVHEEITKTMNDLYGGRGLGSSQISSKIYDAVESKYGNRHPMHNEEIVKKLENTCIFRYGGTNVMHSVEIFERSVKNALKKKEYILPSGRLLSVQGYEPFAIKWLLDNDYSEEDLYICNKDIESRIGKIRYPRGEKMSRYYPDIFILKDNLIIEVKSEYTYNQNKEINELKKTACLNAGLNFKFMIFISVKENEISFYWL
jgi:hypothetical protein